MPLFQILAFLQSIGPCTDYPVMQRSCCLRTRDSGIPILENVDFYKAADRLNDFGFSGWIGPEPHGASKANSDRTIPHP